MNNDECATRDGNAGSERRRTAYTRREALRAAGSLTALTKIEGKMVVLFRASVSSALGAAGAVTDQLVRVEHDAVTGAMQAAAGGDFA